MSDGGCRALAGAVAAFLYLETITMNTLTIDDVCFEGKKVLVRVDFNVPMTPDLKVVRRQADRRVAPDHQEDPRRTAGR